MLFSPERAKARRAALATIALATVGVVGALTLDTDHDGVSRASAAVGAAGRSSARACSGAQSAATVAAVDLAAAHRIYLGELHGTEVKADIGHVTSSPALLSAMAASNTAAVQAAVHGLVYAPHWHIVRLRVLKAGRVLADVGGPYIIAPVTGTLERHGRTVGSYVMSVQDDVGFVKLVSRFIGAPIDIYRDGAFLMGTLQPPPPPPPPPPPTAPSSGSGTTVTVAGSDYRVGAMPAAAFPSGSLEIGVFARVADAGGASCAAIRSAAWGNVATHIAARFKPLAPHYKDLVDIVQSTTDGVAFVRVGSKQVAGSRGPAKLPLSGTVAYRGRRWSVFSFEPVPPTRIYLLTPTR